MAFASWVAERSWLLSVLGEMVAVWTVLALFLATGPRCERTAPSSICSKALDDTEQREERRRQADWQKTLDRAYASVRSGLPAQAYRTVKELVASERDSLEIYQWVFNGMLAWDDPKHAAMFGERFAARLWDADRKVDALELAERCRKMSPSFVPPAAFVAELAAYARSIGRHRSADELTAVASSAPPARLVRVLVAGDQPRAAAIGQVLPQPAKRDEHGARHADQK